MAHLVSRGRVLAEQSTYKKDVWVGDVPMIKMKKVMTKQGQGDSGVALINTIALLA